MDDSFPADSAQPRWMKWWLTAAGIYNLAWGAFMIAFPQAVFDFCGMERLNHPSIWQCVGMIVGVYGIGYLIAAGNSRTHWPIVLVGLLGKLFGPIGFIFSWADGSLPWRFGVVLLTNDLPWWIPFLMILKDAAIYRRRPHESQLTLFVKETPIAVSPEELFRFHESPAALTKLIPPWEAMRVAESPGSLAIGSRVVLRGRAFGLVPVAWRALHTEYDPPHMFADWQESGPFAWWYHTHRCLSDGRGGSLLRDEVKYAVPLGWLGRLVAGRMIAAKLEKMFAYRHEITKRTLEGG